MAKVLKGPGRKKTDIFEEGLRATIEEGCTPEEALKVALDFVNDMPEGPGRDKHEEGFNKAYERIVGGEREV
jgi:hypothetical protein